MDPESTKIQVKQERDYLDILLIPLPGKQKLYCKPRQCDTKASIYKNQYEASEKWLRKSHEVDKSLPVSKFHRNFRWILSNFSQDANEQLQNARQLVPFSANTWNNTLSTKIMPELARYRTNSDALSKIIFTCKAQNLIYDLILFQHWKDDRSYNCKCIKTAIPHDLLAALRRVNITSRGWPYDHRYINL